MKDETIGEFNAWICDGANESFALGTQVPQELLVMKGLKSLHPRFVNKVMAIKDNMEEI